MQTGFYDSDTHRWVTLSTRNATLAELNIPESAISHRNTVPMTVKPPDTGKSGSSNSHSRLSPSSAKQWTTCTAAPGYIADNRLKILPIKVAEVIKLTSYLEHIIEETHDHEKRAMVTATRIQSGKLKIDKLTEEQICDIEKTSGSEPAREGTRAHDWAERVLNGKTTLEEAPFVLRDAIGTYIKHCTELVPEGATPLVEVKVPLFYCSNPNETGTCDFAIVTEERVTIRDYKHGAGVLVDAVENEQLAIYTYSFIKDLEADGMYDFDPATIVDIGIVQPRHHAGDEIKTWILTLSDLALFCSPIEAAAKQIQEGRDLTFAPSEDACRWCDAKSFCPARSAALTEVFSSHEVNGADFLASLPDLTKEDKKMSVADRVMKRVGDAQPLTDEQLVAMYGAAKGIQGFLNDIEEMIEARVFCGDNFNGTYKLVLGSQGNRVWADEEAADKFLKNQRLKEDERYNFKLKSPTMVEALLKDKLTASSRTKNLFLSHITRSEARQVVALASDKRPAISPALDGLDVVEIGDDI